MNDNITIQQIHKQDLNPARYLVKALNYTAREED